MPGIDAASDVAVETPMETTVDTPAETPVEAPVTKKPKLEEPIKAAEEAVKPAEETKSTEETKLEEPVKAAEEAAKPTEETKPAEETADSKKEQPQTENGEPKGELEADKIQSNGHTAELETKASPVLRWAKLSDSAKAPTRGSAKAAGYDLYSAEEATIEPGKRKLVATDIQIEVPSGCYGRVAPRSGLAVKHGIDVGAGVVDEDYRGNVKVLLFNFGDTEFKVAPGDRIAQLVLERIIYADLEELPSLDETARGAGGFGSTGTN